MATQVRPCPRGIRTGKPAAARPGRARAIAAFATALATGSCIVNTDIVPAAFNAGALESAADPFRDRGELRTSIAARMIFDELIDGYFAQGKAAGAQYSVEQWMRNVAKQPGAFVTHVTMRAFGPDRVARASAPPALRTTKAEDDELVDDSLSDATARWIGAPYNQPICKGYDQPDGDAFERVLDEVRFTEAVRRAVAAVSEVLAENLVDENAVRVGAAQAFTQAADYIANRRWRRERDQPTAGLVVKGGAATGIYSAGVVWTVLQMMHRCMADKSCSCGRDLRFKLVSGTSTGAMIAIAVDRFNAATSENARAEEIGNIAKWFTCYSLSDLFCVRSAPILALFSDGEDAQRGVLEFDGIERVLSSCVDARLRENRSELILNTVDFRTGRLFAFSPSSRPTPTWSRRVSPRRCSR
jgi:hypothetical protein